MRLPRPDSSTIILSLLTAVLLVPTTSALAFDGDDMWRLSEASRRAHSEHERLIAQADAARERLLAEAQAARERTLVQAQAARQRLLAQALRDRRRLLAQSQATKRRLDAQRRRRTVTRTERRTRTDGARLEFSFNGVIEGDLGGGDFALNLGLPGAGEVSIHDHDCGEGAMDDLDAPEAFDVAPMVPEVIVEEPDAFDTVPMVPEVEEPEVFVEEPEVFVDDEEPHVAVFEESGDSASSAVNGDYEGVEWAIVERVNAIRATRGLATLTYDPRLQAGAINHSAEMFQMDYFSHTSPVSDHAEFATRIHDEGIGDFGVAGENLVMGPDASNLAERFVDIWMDSPGHRANILGEDFRFTGVGVYGEGERVYATQLFSQRVVRSAE